MRCTMLLGGVWGAIVCLVAASAGAEGIRESNYLHTNPEDVVRLPVVLDPRNGFVRPAGESGVEVSGGMKVSSDGEAMMVIPNTADAASIVFRLDFDACAFGALVSLTGASGTNKVPIYFDFFDARGRAFDRQSRWPASGITSQSYGSTDPAYAFRAVQVSSPSREFAQIVDIRLHPCAPAVS